MSALCGRCAHHRFRGSRGVTRRAPAGKGATRDPRQTGIEHGGVRDEPARPPPARPCTGSRAGNDDLVVAVLAAEPHRHPLDPLAADEIDAARAILADAGLLGESVRVPTLLPHEPEKDELAAWRPGEGIERRVDVTLLVPRPAP